MASCFCSRCLRPCSPSKYPTCTHCRDSRSMENGAISGQVLNSSPSSSNSPHSLCTSCHRPWMSDSIKLVTSVEINHLNPKGDELMPTILKLVKYPFI